MSVVDTSALESQNVVERKAYTATPPDVDMIIENVVGSTGADGVITVRAVSPNFSANSFQYDIAEAGTWGNTTGIFGSLAAGVHVLQARDAVTTANVSILLSITVADLS